MKFIRKCPIAAPLLLGVTLLAVTINAAANPHRKPKRAPAARKAEENLTELIRRAQTAAEQAQAEAARARTQSEALQQQLAQVTQELAALRQTQQQADCSAQLAELTSAVRRLQSDSAAQQETVASSQAAKNSAAISPPPVAAPPAEERLAELADQVEINTAQLKEHAQTKVETDQKLRLKLFGAVIANTYFNSDDSSLNDVPLFANLTNERGRNNLGATLRQTKIGLALSGPRVAGARLSAEADFDFWGGGFNEVLGSFRIRTASARLDWEKTSIEIGQTAPLISPRNPHSLAAVWFAPLTNAGNLWQWRPHLNVEQRVPLGEATNLIAQGGLLPTFGESFRGQVLEGPPAVAARLVWQRNLDNEKQLEIGFAAQRGSKRFGFGRNVNDYIVAGDWQIPLSSRVELSGEAYRGRSVNLSENSGSRLERLYVFSGSFDDPRTVISGVRSSGGWLQLSVQARRDLEWNFAYGQEDPDNRDLRLGGLTGSARLKNQVGSANFIYQLRHNFPLSFEYRRLWTDYATGRRTNNHYNLAVGYLF